MCCLKQSQWIEARNLCDKVLEENAEAAKAYFRRGEALFNLNDHHLGKPILKQLSMCLFFDIGMFVWSSLTEFKEGWILNKTTYNCKFIVLYFSAKQDFVKVLELDPENKAAKNKVTLCQHQIKAQRDKEKRTFANMFDRLVHHVG